MNTEDQYIKAFASRLTTLREIKNVSARDMSLSLGQSHNFMHNIETGKNYPNMLNFFNICEYLGITAKMFFDYEQETPCQDSALLSDIKKLDLASREQVSNLIHHLGSFQKATN